IFGHSLDGEHFATPRVGEQPLQGFHPAPAPCLRCLDDTSLEPTHEGVSFGPINSMPVHAVVGSCTSRMCRCHLLCLLCLSAKRSRNESPDGSPPACPSGIGLYPFDSPTAFACSIVPSPHAYRLPLRVAFPSGRRVGFPRSVSVPLNGLGPACSP